MMKKGFLILFFLFLTSGVFLVPNSFSFAENAEDSLCLVYFTGVGCPYCADTDPVILDELLGKYPNLFVIEYEIYQQGENASLLYYYDENYDSGLGIPSVIFSKENSISGAKTILNNIERVLEKGSNPCPLMNGESIDFEILDLDSLVGFPKIWHQGKILVRTGPKGESETLKKLLTSEDIEKTLEDVDFEEIKPFKVALSGKKLEFGDALKIDDWIFQWNSKGLSGSFGEELSGFLPGGFNLPEGFLGTKGELTLTKVLSLAAVDAINPCALAVLSLMLITILTYSPKKRQNILLAGFAFVVSVFVMYLIYGLVIIKSFQLIQALTSIRIWLYQILGAAAIILGAIKLRDFFRSQSICNVSPKVNKIISKVTSPAGAFAVGAFVTVFLLPCTIGPYIICGGILCPLGILKAIPLLLLYNLVFVLPMIAVVLIIYFGLSKIEDISSWQARNIKYLDLVSGLIIIGLGVAMILGLI